MAEQGYLWESHNGCSRCEALAGFYEAGELPARPHVFCQCDITLQGDVGTIQEIKGQCYFAVIVDIRVHHWEPEIQGSTGLLAYDYKLKCNDGREVLGTVDVVYYADDFFDFDNNEDTFDDGYALALYDAVEKINQNAMESCCPPIIVS